MISKIVSLFIGICVLSSCSSPVKVPEIEGESRLSEENKKRLTDEERFFVDDGFREKLLKQCSKKEIIRRSSYGTWFNFGKCDIAFNGISLGLSRFEIHESQRGVIDALQFMVLPDAEYGKILLNIFRPHSVHRGSVVCTRYYRDTLPLVTIAKASMCDALQYDQI